MAKFTRKNAWEYEGTFNNPDLLWYAKAVGVMQSRTLNDENSWWFFAAMHGEQMGGSTFPNWNVIPGPPNIPTSPLPDPDTMKKYWNQCQHQSWYFAPWHRGYLIALEEQIRQAVISLGGPADWALPYWNYLGDGDQYKIPPAFTQKTLPDGKTPNPLYVTARYGPKSDGNVYVVIPPLSEACQGNTIYTGSNSATSKPGYGGPETKFSHDGATSGNLESNPHNLVHVQVGGNDGIMSDPDSAGLDPIFYLHHCNIDRMWAAWNVKNSNPINPLWLGGPALYGEREFIMPLPDNKAWVYTPEEMTSLAKLDYTYDDLEPTTAPLVEKTLSQRLTKLGVQSVETENLQEQDMDLGDNSELVGANTGQVQIDGSGAKTTVKLESSSWKNVPNSLMKASVSNLPDQVYLQLENVKGTRDANILNVSVNHQLAGHVSLFGLRNASDKDGHNGGTGLTFILNITDIIDNLFINNQLDINSLDVTILPDNVIPSDEKITVGRVSIYREEQKL
ncbi:tyrosinase family protein [Chryseobacterium herbae]|uniref:Tyrosinase family protein n=1 Tax=Chryseobacterium herbae TaxID=2976476 RepID=A0ABT2IX21_9FLAO|nr:tyrosinase family protein [Chryseobacterium sp. pc1-10]MCT2562855.1 tyrosinase family protein [Chryseobacterium sp. pc1-10]